MDIAPEVLKLFFVRTTFVMKSSRKEKKQQKTYTGRILILFFYKHVNEDHHSNT